jgi:type III secretory pathway component EscS
MATTAPKPSGLTIWVKHIDTAVLAVAALAGLFIGLVHAIFEVKELTD